MRSLQFRCHNSFSRITVFFFLFVCFAVIVFGLRSVSAETIQCTEITRLPAVINKSGVHCLKKDLFHRAKTGAAITITRHNVVLDFNGHRISGVAALDNEAAGVRISRRNKVRITNGTIERFRFGLHATGGLGLQVDNMLFDQNRQIGVWLEDKTVGATIKENILSRMGGSTAPAMSFDGFVVPSPAIVVFGRGTLSPIAASIADNTIAGISPVSGLDLVYGIWVSAKDASVERNQVVAEKIDFGITFDANGLVSENRVSSFEGVRSGDFGIFIRGFALYKNNTVLNFARPFESGIDGGGNNDL